MQSSPDTQTGSDRQIQERVAALAKRFSQSEIARRTQTPVSSVNRYLGQTRVPADFCAALVTGLGVNPAWLLTGEGAMYLSDVTAQTADLAAGMLELVNSLVAVSRMRLGSLTGKNHLRVLRDLNEALQTYHGLRDRLNAHSVPILSQLLNDLIRATEKQQLDVAHDLRNAAAQIAQFCHDGELLRRFTAADATYEFAMGNAAKALELSREVFARTLTRTDKPNENALVQAHNLAASLCQNYRFTEAHRVCRLGLALAGQDLQGLAAYHELRTLYGVVSMELGDLQAAAAELLTAWPQTRAHYRRAAQGMIMRGLLLAGVMSFAEAQAWAKDDIGRNRQLLRFALWTDNEEIIARVLDSVLGDSGVKVRPNMLEAVAARLMLKRKTGAARELGEAQFAPIPPSVAAYLRAAFTAQIERDGRRVMEAEACLAALDREVMPDFLSLALHYRNALRFIGEREKGKPGELRARAQSWIQTHRAKGFTFLTGAPEKLFDPRE